jgi:DNA-directed RNA polymerase specialized sigma24 family protein
MKKKKAGRVKFGIDRDIENEQVRKYIETGDELIIEEVYKKRIPTIDHLGRINSWITEDASSEVNLVFVRCIQSYGRNGKTTDFNTFFYSSVKNHFANLLKKKYRKKRTTFRGDDPSMQTVSLDSPCYGDDGHDINLHEIIPDNAIEENDVITECLSEISGGNESIVDILLDFVDLTKRQIVRREFIFDRTFPLISGDAHDDIVLGMGVPAETFEVLTSKVKNDKVFCKIKIVPQEFISHIREKIESNDEVLHTIRR